MTAHLLEAAAETTRDVFSRDHPAVLAVDPGDTVLVRSLDASGYLARQTFPGEEQPKMFPEARGHCLTGPIEVRGARPGDMLALRLMALRPGDWGWTVAAALDTPVTRRLGLAGPRWRRVPAGHVLRESPRPTASGERRRQAKPATR